MRGVVELFLRADPTRCFDAFCDAAAARRWVPGLKKANVVRRDADGHPLEVMYEFGDALSYALVYAYDVAALKVRWVPSSGAMDAVSGHAQFVPAEGGCTMRYSIDSVRGRSGGHDTAVAEAFVEWMHRGAQAR
ncbi:MAG: hypothetical protein JNG84_02220 [Archangium sp.]|nr:hypothetical protein [Archangium sp.]